MEQEKKDLFIKINELIYRKKEKLLNKLPTIIEFDDGAMSIQFFSEWNTIGEDNLIKHKELTNLNDETEKVSLFYIPKGSYFNVVNRRPVKHIICLSGKLEIIFDNIVRVINYHESMIPDGNKYSGKALENTYVLTTSM